MMEVDLRGALELEVNAAATPRKTIRSCAIIIILIGLVGAGQLITVRVRLVLEEREMKIPPTTHRMRGQRKKDRNFTESTYGDSHMESRLRAVSRLQSLLQSKYSKYTLSSISSSLLTWY